MCFPAAEIWFLISRFSCFLMSAWLLGVDCVHSECVFWLSLFLIHKYPECVFRAAAVLDFYLLIGFGAELFLFLTAEDHTCFLSASNIGSLWSKTVKAIEPGKGRIPATRSGHTAWWSHPPWSDAPAVAWSLPLSPRPPWNHNTRGKTETHLKNYSSATETETDSFLCLPAEA